MKTTCKRCWSPFFAREGEVLCRACAPVKPAPLATPEDEAIWGRERHKGEPRRAIPYETLIAKWQKQKEDVGKLKAENRQLNGQNQRQSVEMANLRWTINRLEEDLAGKRHTPFSIPGDMIRRLLQLVHPDKHGNSQAATEVTQWLLCQHKGARC